MRVRWAPRAACTWASRSAAFHKIAWLRNQHRPHTARPDSSRPRKSCRFHNRCPPRSRRWRRPRCVACCYPRCRFDVHSRPCAPCPPPPATAKPPFEPACDGAPAAWADDEALSLLAQCVRARPHSPTAVTTTALRCLEAVDDATARPALRTSMRSPFGWSTRAPKFNLPEAISRPRTSRGSAAMVLQKAAPRTATDCIDLCCSALYAAGSEARHDVSLEPKEQRHDRHADEDCARGEGPPA